MKFYNDMPLGYFLFIVVSRVSLYFWKNFPLYLSNFYSLSYLSGTPKLEIVPSE